MSVIVSPAWVGGAGRPGMGVIAGGRRAFAVADASETMSANEIKRSRELNNTAEAGAMASILFG
jgi:hypothetical protein